jgi:hypothetical protein
MIEIGHGAAPEFKRACDDGGGCVEVAFLQAVAVRDSKDPDGPVLVFTLAEWADFTQGIRLGAFDFS